MPSIFWSLMLVGVSLESGITIPLNSCIIAFAARSLKDGVKASPPDVIHLVMGLVNLLLQCILTVQSFLFVLCVSVLFIREVFLPITIVILSLICFSSWLNVWLSAYYCTNITNFTYPPFIWSRRILSSSLWLLLLLSAVWSVMIGASSVWALSVEVETDCLDNCTAAGSFVKGTFYFSQRYVLIATVLGSFLPFMLILFSILLTFSSLMRHVRNIKQNYSGFTRQVHLNAIRKMCLLFTLSIIFCIAQLMYFSSTPSSSLQPLVTISWSIILMFPMADAIIIIQVSSKIQKMFVKSVCWETWRQKAWRRPGHFQDTTEP